MGRPSLGCAMTRPMLTVAFAALLVLQGNVPAFARQICDDDFCESEAAPEAVAAVSITQKGVAKAGPKAVLLEEDDDEIPAVTKKVGGARGGRRLKGVSCEDG